MKSQNFEIVRDRWPELASLGSFAEQYVYTDPPSSLVKLRAFSEYMTRGIYSIHSLPMPYRATFVDLLKGDAFVSVVPRVILNKLHSIRMQGNKAAHGESVKPQTALWLLCEAHDLIRWLLVNFEKVDPALLPKFENPTPPQGNDLKEIERIRRKTQEALAAKEEELKVVLAELEEERSKTKTAERTKEELQLFAKEASNSADVLKFDEATTRSRIIDGLLASAGWSVGEGMSSTDEVVKELEVDGQPTASGKGFVDYVLKNDDGLPLAIIEAKKTSVEPERGRKQAKLYADSVEKSTGQRPVIYYTNGYDIWLWDDVEYPPRKVHGYYSKDSLEYLVKFQRSNRKELAILSPQENIVNRLYQLEAIKRVCERFEEKHRKCLIVQATGTGKTRVAIALSELLIRAGWAKRILFLCDRRELRKQGKNAFTDFLPEEPIKVVSSRVSGSASERIFVATYPAMLKVYQSFDVGFFDLIIADESHRSIYNIYGELFRYFDSLQVGLTATPVDFVSRNTFDLFHCEGQLPTANYDLEQAVEDDYLVPYEVFDHTTQFLRDGIKLDGLTASQLQELEDQGEDPLQYNFTSNQIDKAVYNKDTNRVVLRNLMENGLRDSFGQVIGKTIIFARNHDHAILMLRLFDEMYPQYRGNFCQVIDNYNPRAEQLIDDFKDKDNELTIAISVDMLDTGIDVPEILNLVFAKPIGSPVKFWQMVGRGTRLCEHLFGSGQHKTVFRIFDHWGNFERFESGYQPVEPRQSKSLLQVLFEQRVTLAETALQRSEIDVFDTIINLVESDIVDLPEESVSVREKWRERRSVLETKCLSSFAPATVVLLRNTIAPLMQWRNVRGFSEAYSFDLLVAKMQLSMLNRASILDDLKVDFFERLDRLQMNLNQVREQAEVLRLVRSDQFWVDATVDDLESIRIDLRKIMKYREKHTAGPRIPKIIDVTEDSAGIVKERRSTYLKSVHMKAYEKLVEAELRQHFDSNPTLRKIRSGHPVSNGDIQALISLVLTQNPDVKRDHLEEFFQEKAPHLDVAIRSVVGMDSKAVKKVFSEFVLAHPALTAKQTRFLALLQNHINKFGFITVERLYDQPFTVIDADGPEGIFDNGEDIDDLMQMIELFGSHIEADTKVEKNNGAPS